MKNILIISESLLNDYNIAKNIVKEPKTRFNIIFSNYTDGIEFIKNKIPDIILMIEKTFDDIDIQNIIKYIDSNNLKKYNKSIIIYTKMYHISKNKIENKYILKYVESVEQFNKLVLFMNKKDIDDKQHILEKIKSEMKKLNFNFSYIGTKYLVECIFEIYLNKNYENFNLNRDFYPIISKRYNISVNNVKCNITQAYMKMLCDCSIKQLENYLKIYVGIQNPKKKEVINAILRNII